MLIILFLYILNPNFTPVIDYIPVVNIIQIRALPKIDSIYGMTPL